MGLLSLNQDELLQLFKPHTDLNEIIQHYEVEFEKRGEVICRIRLNDLCLSEEDEFKFKETPLSHISTLVVETEDPSQLFKDVLNHWKSFLPTLIDSADQISQKLRFSTLDRSAYELSQFIDQSHLLVNSLSSISSLCKHRCIDLPASWNASEIKLWMAFNELLDSFNDKNINLMADIIEYNLSDSLHTWFKVLSEMPS